MPTTDNDERGFASRVLDRLFARQDEMNRRRRELQINAALAGLEELKRQNAINPTAKRSAMIQLQEERMRKNGILR